MKTAWFDCTYGISGDMTLGALIDLGVPLDKLKSALASLPISGWSIQADTVMRCGVKATRVKVRSDEKQPHRGFNTIREIIAKSHFSDSVKARATEGFHKLAIAEAEVHDTTVDAVHFHEVGAVDAIIDIVGSMWCFEYLGIGDAVISEVSVGSGTVKAAHGTMPVPAPATAKLLAGVPITTGPVGGELTTPTGAAILRTMCSTFAPPRGFRIEKIGHGAGTREYSGHTNYLRISLGEMAAAGLSGSLPLEHSSLVVLQTEIDDMNPEIYSHVLDRLFTAGCLDAFVIPVQMKKNRPGATLQVLAKPDAVPQLVELILRETTTFGVKVIECERYCLPRRVETVETAFGPIKVKIGLWGNQPLKASPEYEDCRRIAGEKNVPITQVYAAAAAAAQRLLQ